MLARIRVGDWRVDGRRELAAPLRMCAASCASGLTAAYGCPLAPLRHQLRRARRARLRPRRVHWGREISGGEGPIISKNQEVTLIIRRLTHLAAVAAIVALVLLPLAATSASAASYPALTKVHDPGHVTGTMYGRCYLRANGSCRTCAALPAAST